LEHSSGLASFGSEAEAESVFDVPPRWTLWLSVSDAMSLPYIPRGFGTAVEKVQSVNRAIVTGVDQSLQPEFV
jgi:hypothetical protein